MACDFPFQAVASQLSDTTWFLTTLTNPVYWLFLDNNIFRKSQHNQRLQIKVKHLVVKTNQEAARDIYIKILVLKMPRSRLVCPLDWLVTVRNTCHFKNDKGYPVFGHSWSIIWHYMIPNNTRHSSFLFRILFNWFCVNIRVFL